MSFHLIPPCFGYVGINVNKKQIKKPAGDSIRIRSKHKSLIVRSPLPGSLAQAGTYLLRSLYLLTGVAVASQVLCTSTTLNKRTWYVIIRESFSPIGAYHIASGTICQSAYFTQYFRIFGFFWTVYDFSAFYIWRNTLYTHTYSAKNNL